MSQTIRKRALLFAMLAMSIAGRPAAAQQPGVHFRPISELDPGAQAGTALMKAKVANPKEWPASFFSVHPGGACTSTLVGPRVLLTAAHCTPNGGTATIAVGTNTLTAVCTHSPGYKNNGTQLQRTEDYALCVFASDVAGIPFEHVNTDPSRVAVNTVLLLTGFGCVKPPPAPSDGLYRIGEAPVVQVPSAASHDIVTQGDVALCFGDSGGPAVVFLDPGKTKRVQVSVNSRGNIQDTSFLSSLTAPPAVKFIADWSAKHQVKICGVHADATGCR